MSKSLLLISLLALAIALSGCQTRVVEIPRYILPTLDAFEPPRVPDGLIDEPLTDADLLSNSVSFEFLLYDWQDYADSLARYLAKVQEALLKDP